MTNCTCGDKPKPPATPPPKRVLTIEERHGVVVYRG